MPNCRRSSLRALSGGPIGPVTRRAAGETSLLAAPPFSLSIGFRFTVYRGRQKGVNIAGARHAKAYDLSRIIDRTSTLQIQRRVRRDEGVEIHRHFILPDEGSAVPHGVT